MLIDLAVESPRQRAESCVQARTFRNRPWAVFYKGDRIGVAYVRRSCPSSSLRSQISGFIFVSAFDLISSFTCICIPVLSNFTIMTTVTAQSAYKAPDARTCPITMLFHLHWTWSWMGFRGENKGPCF